MFAMPGIRFEYRAFLLYTNYYFTMKINGIKWLATKFQFIRCPFRIDTYICQAIHDIWDYKTSPFQTCYG